MGIFLAHDDQAAPFGAQMTPRLGSRSKHPRDSVFEKVGRMRRFPSARSWSLRSARPRWPTGRDAHAVPSSAEIDNANAMSGRARPTTAAASARVSQSVLLGF
jgi:hypothetical protein